MRRFYCSVWLFSSHVASVHKELLALSLGGVGLVESWIFLFLFFRECCLCSKNLIKMRFTSSALVISALTLTTFAQDNKTLNLTQLLNSQTNLTNFTNLLTTYGADIYANLSTQQNITIFAPSDLAFAKIPSQVLGPAFATNDTDVLRALIQYHVLPGTYPTSTFNGSFQFPPTLLNSQTYSNVTGGQVVALVQQAGNTSVAVTGLGSRSTLITTV